MKFEIWDFIIFGAYCLLIAGTGIYVSRKKKGEVDSSSDYFLANKSLPWWAVGASLIASNISAEQLIGMSGSGYAIGMAISIYEWIAALGLILLGKFFLPVFLKNNIYTMPQFLEQRYDSRVRTSLALFWIALYTLVNLTSVLYLGALSLKTIMGVDLIYGVLGLAVFSVVYSIYGGLKSIAWTDVIQVVFLIGGGLLTTYLAFLALAENFGGSGILDGVSILYEKATDKFNLILDKDDPNYINLPGASVLFGGMWVINLNYWCFNQYITQRTLAAISLREAQKGVIFAGYLKLLMPLIVVVPGVIAYILTENSLSETPDQAYPWLLHNLIPTGIKGLAFAALIAAIVSSVSSMVNSISSIFTIDIYKPFFSRNKENPRKEVFVGRTSGVIALLIAVIIAPALTNLQQAFQFIQEFTGLISPGIVVIFLLGIFWKKTTSDAALATAIATLPLGMLIKHFMPAFPWLNRMGIMFLILLVFAIVISKLSKKQPDDSKVVHINEGLFKTSFSFNLASIGILIILSSFYIAFW